MHKTPLVALEDAVLGLFVEHGRDYPRASLAMPAVRHCWRESLLREEDLSRALGSLVDVGLCRLQGEGEQRTLQLTTLGADYLACGAVVGQRWHQMRRRLVHHLDRYRSGGWRRRGTAVIQRLASVSP